MNFSLTEQLIKNYSGAESFVRGSAYFVEGRVKNLKYAPVEGIIEAGVWGNGSSPYRVEIFLDNDGIDYADCTCPIGDQCKHIVAVGLAWLEKYGALYEFSIKNVGKNFGLSDLSNAQPAWMKALSAIPTGKNSGHSTTHVFELVFRLVKESGRHDGEWKLQVRPRGKNRRTGGSSWNTFGWKDSVQEESYLVPSTITHPAFTFFHTLFRLLNKEHHYYGVSAWINIEPAEPGLFWHWLGKHSEHGVDLVFGENPTFPLNISALELVPTINLKQEGKKIIISRSMYMGGGEITGLNIMFGLPAVFAFVAPEVRGDEEINFSFHPVSRRFDREAWQALDKSLAVPARDKVEFLNNFLPVLARAMTVKSFIPDIVVPEVIKPELVLSITPGLDYGLSVKALAKYGAAAVPLGEPEGIVLSGVTPIIRDTEAELELADEASKLLANHGVVTRLGESGSVNISKNEAVPFYREHLPALRTVADVRVDVQVPDYELMEGATAEFSVGNSDSTDWFDLLVIISVGGAEIPVHELLPALNRGEEYLFLPEGKIVSLGDPVFERIRQLMKQAAELPDPQSGRISVSRYQAGWWEELSELGVVKAQSKEWKRSIRGLLDFDTLHRPTPPVSLNATLRNYQAEGLAWLAFLREQGLGGVLADDMGLGKTIQSIALVCLARQNNKKKKLPFLVIAPTSVVENWDSEFQKFAPSLSVVVLRSGDRSIHHKQIPSGDVVVTSYALLHRDQAELAGQDWDTIIIDEAQAVKNFQSKSYSVIRKLKAACRIALTGTPMENNLMELWSIFSIVAPGLFPPPERFNETFRRPIEKFSDSHALQGLRRRIKPFLLRRKKELVAGELPPKTETVLRLEMGKDQRSLYDLFLQKQRQKVLGLLAEGGMKAHRFEILTALTRLRQLCLHPVLVDSKYEGWDSVKIDALFEQLEPIVSEGHKVLVFSQFTSFLSLIRKRLEVDSTPFCYLDGSTRNRKEVIGEFQESRDKQIFLMSLKAGGVGLNLTAADYCIVMDPWWNPAVENQAIARTHRIGQTRHVMVYRLIVKNTIEEKVLKLQEKKKRLFDNVLEEGEAFGSLITEDDIKNLFN